jgi:hypothetical protein
MDVIALSGAADVFAPPLAALLVFCALAHALALFHRAPRLSHMYLELLTHAYLALLGAQLVRSGVLASATPANVHGAWLRSETPRAVYNFFAAQALVYAAALMSALVDARTPDRARMLAHHAVTLALIAYAHTHGLWRIGAFIMLACDPSDVALHVGKWCKDVLRSEGAATASFVVFLGLWCRQRLYLLVGHVIVPYVLTSVGVAPSSAAFRALAPPETSPGVAGGLALIGALFVWWSVEIARVMWRKLRHGEIADVRDE